MSLNLSLNEYAKQQVNNKDIFDFNNAKSQKPFKVAEQTEKHRVKQNLTWEQLFREVGAKIVYEHKKPIL